MISLSPRKAFREAALYLFLQPRSLGPTRSSVSSAAPPLCLLGTCTQPSNAGASSTPHGQVCLTIFPSPPTTQLSGQKAGTHPCLFLPPQHLLPTPYPTVMVLPAKKEMLQAPCPTARMPEDITGAPGAARHGVLVPKYISTPPPSLHAHCYPPSTSATSNGTLASLLASFQSALQTAATAGGITCLHCSRPL